LSADLDHVAHLVDQDHEHKPECERPTKEDRVGAEADRQSEQRLEGPELEQEEPAVLEEGPDRQQDAAQATEKTPAAATLLRGARRLGAPVLPGREVRLRRRGGRAAG